MIIFNPSSLFEQIRKLLRKDRNYAEIYSETQTCEIKKKTKNVLYPCKRSVDPLNEHVILNIPLSTYSYNLLHNFNISIHSGISFFIKLLTG